MFTKNVTPGKWNMACDSYGKVQHSRKYDCVYSVVKGDGGDRIVSIAARIENSKDALLIAAAPDLLAALAALLNCPELNLDELSPELGPAIERAHAAIAKAEGKRN